MPDDLNRMANSAIQTMPDMPQATKRSYPHIIPNATTIAAMNEPSEGRKRYTDIDELMRDLARPGWLFWVWVGLTATVAVLYPIMAGIFALMGKPVLAGVAACGWASVVLMLIGMRRRRLLGRG